MDTTTPPLAVYVFLLRRPKDKQPWPVVYQTREVAEKAEHRASQIVELLFDANGAYVNQEADHLKYQLGYEKGCQDGALQQAREQVRVLQEQLGAQMAHEQVISQKWQRLIEEVGQELRLRTKAKLSSACSCPIGTCLEWGGVKQDGACWFQWAEGHILKRAGELRIDFLRQMANHPARVAAVAEGRGDEPLNPA